MSRRPSFQFYHGDWSANAKLRRCTKEEKGHWIDVLCMFADADEFGILRWPLIDIAESIGGKVAALKALIRKGVLKGANEGERCSAYVYVPRSGRREGDPVVLIPEQDGPIWYSSKMVRDEYIKSHAGASTRFGARAPSQRQSESPSQRQSESPSQPPSDHQAGGEVSPSHRRGDGSSSSSSSSSLKASPRARTRARALIGVPVDKSVDNSSPSAHMLAQLRDAHVQKPANTLLASWVKAGVTDAQLAEAITRAREYKPRPQRIPARYLDPILGDVMAGKTSNGAWWSTREGIDRKGRELGMTAGSHESYDQFKARIFERLKEAA